MVASASRSPVALLTAWGNTIRRERLNASVNGNSIARITSRTVLAMSAAISMTHSPSVIATPRSRSASLNAAGGGAWRRIERPLAGKATTAPFSPTMASARSRSPATFRRSAS